MHYCTSSLHSTPLGWAGLGWAGLGRAQRVLDSIGLCSIVQWNLIMFLNAKLRSARQGQEYTFSLAVGVALGSQSCQQ